jgi:hypothetical protein
MVWLSTLGMQPTTNAAMQGMAWLAERPARLLLITAATSMCHGEPDKRALCLTSEGTRHDGDGACARATRS